MCQIVNIDLLFKRNFVIYFPSKKIIIVKEKLAYQDDPNNN